MEGRALSRRSSNEGKLRMAMACSFLQVDEMYPDQEKALAGFLKEEIFSSARTQSISDPSSDLNKIRSVYMIGKEKRTVC